MRLILNRWGRIEEENALVWPLSDAALHESVTITLTEKHWTQGNRKHVVLKKMGIFSLLLLLWPCLCGRILLSCLGIVFLCVMSWPAAPSCTGAGPSRTWRCCWFTFVPRTASALNLMQYLRSHCQGLFSNYTHQDRRASEPTCKKVRQGHINI